MCIKKGRDIALLFLGERGNKLQRHLTNFLLGQHHPSVWMLVHIPAQLRAKLSPRKALVSFLDMLSPGIDAMT